MITIPWKFTMPPTASGCAATLPLRCAACNRLEDHRVTIAAGILRLRHLDDPIVKLDDLLQDRQPQSISLVNRPAGFALALRFGQTVWKIFDLRPKQRVVGFEVFDGFPIQRERAFERRGKAANRDPSALRG